MAGFVFLGKRRMKGCLFLSVAIWWGQRAGRNRVLPDVNSERMGGNRCILKHKKLQLDSKSRGPERLQDIQPQYNLIKVGCALRAEVGLTDVWISQAPKLFCDSVLQNKKMEKNPQTFKDLLSIYILFTLNLLKHVFKKPQFLAPPSDSLAILSLSSFPHP